MAEKLKAGDAVRLPDGRCGSFARRAKGKAIVNAPTEGPHPEKTDRLLAAIEEVAIAERKLERWTPAIEAEHQAGLRKRDEADREEVEERRQAQIAIDAQLERLVQEHL